MKPILAGLFLFVLGVLTLSAEGSSYSMDVDVNPDGSGRDNAFVCNVVVTDLETGAPVMAPKVSLLADGTATVSTTEEGREFVLTLLIDSKASKTIAELKVSREGKVIAGQKASVAFHR